MTAAPAPALIVGRALAAVALVLALNEPVIFRGLAASQAVQLTGELIEPEPM